MNITDARKSHIGVLEDLASVVAEELRLASPNKLKCKPNDEIVALCKAQHERDIAAVMKALTTCGLDLPLAKYLALCRDRMEFDLDPRSK